MDDLKKRIEVLEQKNADVIDLASRALQLATSLDHRMKWRSLRRQPTAEGRAAVDSIHKIMRGNDDFYAFIDDFNAFIDRQTESEKDT